MKKKIPAAPATIAAICLMAGTAHATPPFGFTSETFRGKIGTNVNSHQWIPNPLFTMLIQSSSDQWGFDVVQGTTTFAPADATGRPSQSGWHDHPTAISIGLVIQGTIWAHEKPNLSCLHPTPTGSVFFERSGSIHNVYNLEQRTAAVVRIIHFIDRNQAATRRDQPDQVTGDPTVASAPPAPCLEGDHDHAEALSPPLTPIGLPWMSAPLDAILPPRNDARRTHDA